MKRNKKTDILFLKFKIKYRSIFFNKKLKDLASKHFDSKMGFAAFVVGLIDNQLGDKKVIKNIELNYDEWIKIFLDIYSDKNIINSFETLSLNPIISIEEIEKHFDCFDVCIDRIVQYIKLEQLDIQIPDAQLKYVLKSSFGFIMYNCIDCKLPYHLKDILSDIEYDQKFRMITFNTKLFAKAKNSILSNCKTKISDLISLLLGISKDLSLDK